MLSRLKGIETFHCALVVMLYQSTCIYAFPFEGNWNPFFFCCWLFCLLEGAYMPSRLKGIETCRKHIIPSLGIMKCIYAFPFEGNWNKFPFRDMSGIEGEVHICLPVWRELKLEKNLSISFNLNLVHICLPVWRELKRKMGDIGFHPGNPVHICLPVWRECEMANGKWRLAISKRTLLANRRVL